jgi:hypothetical protein
MNGTLVCSARRSFDELGAQRIVLQLGLHQNRSLQRAG